MPLFYDPDATIAAIATPPGEGGVAIVRISGNEALQIADRVFSGDIFDYMSHTLHFGRIIDAKKNVVDEALVAVFHAPNSYTGDDIVEIHCHGGSLITKQVLETVLSAGAKAAGPGEFTYRAFLCGKLDLTQAEAVQSLIGAKNTLSLNQASQQLEGRLSKRVAQFQTVLLDTAAILEAWVDFPEEGLEFASKEEVIHSLRTVQTAICELIDTFPEGRKLHEGIKLALIGCPNAGKSSLMNALLGHERAIVTPVPGTTRDQLDAELSLGGLHYQLVDTAGIRATDEVVEQEGIRRSERALREADLVLLLLDLATPHTDDAKQLIANAPKGKTLLVGNKIDLPQAEKLPEIHPGVCISAKTGEGLKPLKKAIEEMVWEGGVPEKGEVILTNVRHKESLTEAVHALESVLGGLKTEISPEFLSADMRSALQSLGEIIGMDISEKVLSSIFAKFCVGK